MAQPFWNQLGDGVKILVGVVTLAGVLVGSVLWFASVSERTAALEVRADKLEDQSTKIETLLVSLKDIIIQVKEDVAVIRSVIQVTPSA